MPRTILIVDADREALAETTTVLANGGYTVISVDSFVEARKKLSAHPDVVIADVQLGEFNGLHLLARARHENPDCRIILTHRALDPVLEAEASRLGSAYMVKPLASEKLLGQVSYLLKYRTSARRWARKAVAGEIVAQVEDSSATIADLSYGGLRLKLLEPPRGGLRDEMTVKLPSIGLIVQAQLIWASRTAAPSCAWSCGMEITAPDQEIGQWREFVDSIH